MAYAKAGRYNEILLERTGEILPLTAVRVYLAGTTTNATLYADRTKAQTATNPATSDANGNIAFYADPGLYDLLVNGTTISAVVVDNDPADAASLGQSTAQTFAGDLHNKGTRPWRDPAAYATGGTGTAASPWTGWEAAFTADNGMAGSTDLTTGANFPLRMGRGFYALSTTLAPRNSASHFSFKGAGKHATTLVWTGGNAPMVKLVNPRNVLIADMAIIGDSAPANRPTYGVEINRGASLVGSPGPTAVRMRNVWMGGTSADAMTTAIGFTADSGFDLNNDVGTFEDVEILNVGTGYKFGHVNTIWHTIIGGNVSSCSVAAFDNTPAGGVATGGTYRIFGTVTSGNAETFRVGPIVGLNTIDVFGLTGESETKLITTPTALGSSSVRMNFYGGHISCFDPGGSYTIEFNSSASISGLSFHGFSLGSPTGIKVNLPTTGPTMTVDGGTWVTASWRFAGALVLENLIEQAGAPTFTRLTGGTLVERNYRGHDWVEGASAPVVSVGGAVGPGGAVTVSGNDHKGVLTITVDASPGGAGSVTQVTFASAFPAAPVVVLTPYSAPAAEEVAKFHVGVVTSASWLIEARATLTVSTVYKFAYVVG